MLDIGSVLLGKTSQPCTSLEQEHMHKTTGTRILGGNVCVFLWKLYRAVVELYFSLNVSEAGLS